MTCVRIYSGVRSPYSRLGMQVAKQGGVKAEVLPFIGPPEGVPFSNPTDNPLKLAYIMQDAPRMAKRLGLKMTMPKVFEVNYKNANFAQLGATKDGCGLEFACAIAEARWGAGEDISDIDILKRCADEAGWSADALEVAVNGEDSATKISWLKEQIAKDGVFGVPFAVLETQNATQKYWGHDRFEMLVKDMTLAL